MTQDLAPLMVPTSSLKMLRETLCEAQSGLTYRPGNNATYERHRGRLQMLINQIDNHRPLGPDGKHGNRHTPTCGCVDKP